MDAVEQAGDHCVVAFSWSDSEGQRHEWAHLLTLRDDRIVAMQDYASSSKARCAL